MSYPAPTGYGTNLACDTSLQRGTDTFLFQLNDGAATNESTLVSPAAITPTSANGNVSLAMTTATPGSSILTMVGGSTIINMTDQGGNNQINMNGQNTSINLSSNQNATVSIVGGGAAQPGTSTILLGSTNAGGVNDILFGNPTTTGIALYQATAVPGQLSVGNNFTGVNVASFNQTVNNVTLGNSAVAGRIDLNAHTFVNGSSNTVFDADPASNSVTLSNDAASGTISLQATTFISSNTSGSLNTLRLSAETPTTSSIYQTPEGAGTLNLGASVENPKGIFITDPTGVADEAYVDITKGTSTGAALRLQGYGAGTAATVSTNLSTGGGGVLNLTSGYNDPVLTPALAINDTEVVTNRQLVLRGANSPVANWTGPGAPSGTPNIILRTAQVSVGSFTVDISPLPTGWALIYGAVTPGSTPAINDQAAMFSVMVYTDASNKITGGGVGGVGGLVTVQPNGTTSLGVNIAAATTANYLIYGITMFAN